MTQRVELLAVSPGESPSGEKTVLLTIRADKGSFRPHNVALSRQQAIRLLKSLRTVLRQSVGVFLLGLGLATASGCSAEVHVTTEETAPRIDATETAQPATGQRTTTDVAVRLLDERKPSPVEEPSPAKSAAAAPPPDPKQGVEVVGDGNAVLVVEGDLHLHRHAYEAPQLEHVEIEIRSNDVERSERCERLRREYEEKVRQLRRMFNQ